MPTIYGCLQRLKYSDIYIYIYIFAFVFVFACAFAFAFVFVFVFVFVYAFAFVFVISNLHRLPHAQVIVSLPHIHSGADQHGVTGIW